MKILIQHDGSLAHYFTRLGLARAYVAAGHEATLWDIRKKSAFDAFDEFQPDIFEGQTYNLTDAIIECIYQRPFLRTYFKASDWGYKTQEIASKYPVLTATEQEKEMVAKLKSKTNQVGFLFVHHHPDYLDDTHGFWKDVGYKVISLMNAADTFDFTNGQKQKKYECDIAFCGGYWGYKAQVLDRYLLPLCQDFKYNIKIWGNQQWPAPQYCGYIADSEVKHALASAKICVNLHEPHSHEYGYDIVERPFKLASNKCFMVTDKVEGLEKLFNKEKKLQSLGSPEEFIEWIKSYLNNWDYVSIQETVNNSINYMYNEVIEKHTYFDRAAQVFETLGLKTEEILNKKKEILKL